MSLSQMLLRIFSDFLIFDILSGFPFAVCGLGRGYWWWALYVQAARWLPVGLGVGFGGWGCRGWVFLGAAAGRGVFGAGPGFWVGWRSAGGGGRVGLWRWAIILWGLDIF